MATAAIPPRYIHELPDWAQVQFRSRAQYELRSCGSSIVMHLLRQVTTGAAPFDRLSKAFSGGRLGTSHLHLFVF
jgi:hypothetical protein